MSNSSPFAECSVMIETFSSDSLLSASITSDTCSRTWGTWVPSCKRSTKPPAVPRLHGCSRSVGSASSNRSLKPASSAVDRCSSDPRRTSQAITGARRQ